MKREIKFRFWNKKNGCFEEAYSVSSLGINQDMIELTDRYDILQYTDCYDKNGKRICQDDLIKCNEGRVAQVIKTKTGWAIRSKPYTRLEMSLYPDSGSFVVHEAHRYNDLKLTEVIGTFQENPELLK